MTPFRFRELKSLGFEWKTYKERKKGTRKKPSLDADATSARAMAVEALEHVQTTAQTQEGCSAREICSNQVDGPFEPEGSDWKGEVHLGYIPGRTEEI